MSRKSATGSSGPPYDVFGELGFHRATMQDIVASSGLSVGAIYTYFGSKDELFLAGCDFTTESVAGADRGPAAEGHRRPASASTSPSASTSTRSTARPAEGRASAPLQAWAEAEQEPAVREMLARRREQMTTIGP